MLGLVQTMKNFSLSFKDKSSNFSGAKKINSAGKRLAFLITNNGLSIVNVCLWVDTKGDFTHINQCGDSVIILVIT